MEKEEASRWRKTLHEIIFEADTPAGKLFDVLLIVSIIVSVVLVMLDSVAGIREACGFWLCLGKGFSPCCLRSNIFCGCCASDDRWRMPPAFSAS